MKGKAGRLASKHALSFLYCGARLPGWIQRSRW